jgi:glyoxylase-like metal-dependent hydrolase (beta-lactamase superfamily II)
MKEVAPGLRYWKAPHPEWEGATDWPEDVGCVYYEAADALALIDPLVPRGSEESFLAALDRDVARVDRPFVVMLTAPWHKRDAAAIAERYGATVWAHPAAQARLPFETHAGQLSNGIEAFSAGGVWEGDVAFYIRPHRALVVAELFTGAGGGLRVCPSPALRDRDAFETSLQTLLDWPIEHVLVSHGEPVIGDGGRRIREALREFADTRGP